MTDLEETPKKRTPFVSNYDPSIFYTPMHNDSDQPTRPIRNLVSKPIKLTVTLKDIGLEGLDSSSPDKASNIRKRNLQKKQEKARKSHRSFLQEKSKKKQEKTIQQQKSVSPPTIQPRPMSPRIKKLFGQSAKLTPIYEGTFYKSQPQDSDDPKPIGLLSVSQKSKPQPIIPKTSPRGSPRLNTSGSGIFNSSEKDKSDHSNENAKNQQNNSTNPLDKLFDNNTEEQTEVPLEPTYLITVKEDRNQCYDNFCINADRGMPGNPLEKEIQEQEEREAAEIEDRLSIEPLKKLLENKSEEQPEKAENEDEKLSTKPLMTLLDSKPEEQAEKSGNENEKLSLQPLMTLLDDKQDNNNEAPLEPTYSVTIKEDRNQCYDNIYINSDRGMPGNPLEKELLDEEEREAAELEEDFAFYRSLLDQNRS